MLKNYILVFVFFTFAILPIRSNAQTDDQRPPIRPDLKSRIEARIENNENNRNIRQVEKRIEINKGEIREKMELNREERREKMELNESNSTTSSMFKKNAKEEMKKRMEIKTFEIRKNALIRELRVSIRNLDNVDTRIKSRIEKISSEGKDVTEIKSLLVTAEDKLAKAKSDVEALNNLKPASTTSSTGEEVDLSKPRTLGDTAIKSVKEARDAFKKVVSAIAHLMGEDAKEATTTPVSNK